MLFEHSPIGTWKEDENGFLRVRANLLSAGVMVYGANELPDEYGSNGNFNINVPPEQVFDDDVMQSVEGMPVVADYHKWIDADDKSRGAYEIGSVAGSPRENGAYLEADLVIRDKDTINKIKSGELKDVSSGYRAKFDKRAGSYAGKSYAGEQRDIRFNHIALLPEGEGRGGRDIRILNSGSKVKSMEWKIVVNSSGQSFRMHPEDAPLYEADQKSHVENQATSASELEAVMSKVAELNAQIAELTGQKDEALGQLTEMKARIEELTNPANMQEAANKMAEEQKEAGEMLVNSGAEADKEKAMNSIQNLHGHGLRVQVVNSIRGVQKRDSLTKEQSESESYVSGLYSAMGDFVKAGTDTGKTVVGAPAVKVENANKEINDPLGFGSHAKFMNGES